jgi:hypothetical protein
MRNPDFPNRPEPERPENELPGNHLTIWVASSVVPPTLHLAEMANAPFATLAMIATPAAPAASRKGDPPLNPVPVHTCGPRST